MSNHVDYLVNHKWTHIVLHCSDSEWGDRDDINGWHVKRGWDEIGYHFVVCNSYHTYNDWNNNRPDMRISGWDGYVQHGRSLNEDGAHAKGWNKKAIGICLIGKRFFSSQQMRGGIGLVQTMMTRFNIPKKRVLGHCELPNVTKTCPVFNMDHFRDHLT